jgi:uracil-DNA glycosylase
MDWEKFKDKFDESWHNKIRKFIESEECDKIYEFLKNEAKRGKKIAPSSDVTFRCFKETKLDDVKVVLLGMCPYHTFINYEPIADGLLMGCSKTMKLQPSLTKFYEGIEKEIGIKAFKDPDVSYLAHQGVLMLNAGLTVEMNKPGSHNKIWEPFTKYVIEEILSLLGVPFIFLGKDAQYYERFVGPFTWTFNLSHPASAAYSNGDWDTEQVFTKVNKVIKGNNNHTINWIKEK